MFVLVGQILNSRGRFGPMMWAPIANNLVAIGVLVTYLLAYGAAGPAEQGGAFTPGQEALLGLGSTLGIVIQLVVLIPYLRSAGYRFHARFDFRDAGLGHTLRLGVWTLLFVLVNQLAYAVVVRLASSGPAETLGNDPGATGYLVYSSTFLIVMVPHSVVTVSLATAVLPRMSGLAAEGDHRELARTLLLALRNALVVIVPFALLLPLVSLDAAHVIWGWGAGTDTYPNFAPSLGLFGIGLVFFTIHYLMLRGFYALEQTRTVFWIQCSIAVTNVGVAVLLVREATAAQTSPALVLAYGASYLVGAAVSSTVLARPLRGAGGEGRALVGFAARLLAVAVPATAAAYVVGWLLGEVLGPDPNAAAALLRALVVTGVDVVGFVVLARLVGLREVTAVLDLVAGRGSSRGRDASDLP